MLHVLSFLAYFANIVMIMHPNHACNSKVGFTYHFDVAAMWLILGKINDILYIIFGAYKL